MSHVDSKDDVKGRILLPEKTDDSKESNKSKKTDEGTDWETNELEDADIEW